MKNRGFEKLPNKQKSIKTMNFCQSAAILKTKQLLMNLAVHFIKYLRSVAVRNYSMTKWNALSKRNLEKRLLTRKAYYAKQKGKLLPDNLYNCNENSIVGILERMDYCRHTVNFKSYLKSHKLKKRVPITKEQQAIFRNTHEVIVEKVVFERVQEL